MAFADLAASPSLVREYEFGTFAEYQDGDITSQKTTIVRDAIAADLSDALGVAGTISTSTLDTVAANFPTEISRAATLKFLELWFRENDAGEGSLSRLKSKQYAEDYNRARVGFRRFATATSSNQITLYR